MIAHKFDTYLNDHEFCIQYQGRWIQVPRRRIDTIQGEVNEHWIANVVVERGDLATLIGYDALEPLAIHDQYVLSLCFITMNHAAPTWAPLKLGPSSKNAALRVACRHGDTGAKAAWITEGYSDCRLVNLLAKLNFPRINHGLEVDQHGRVLQVQAGDNSFDLDLAYGAPIKDQIFTNTKEFEDYFGSDARSYGPGRKPHSTAIVDLHKENDNHFVALPNWSGTLTALGKTFRCTSVYRTCYGLYEWRHHGDLVKP